MIARREFITLLGGAAAHGRSRRRRNRRGGYRPSEFWGVPRLRPRANGSPLLSNACKTLAGSRVVPSR